MSTPCVDISPTVADFEVAAAGAIAAVITAAVRARGGCLIALSGGNTPRGVYRRLGDLLSVQPENVRRLHIAFSDERMVAPDDPDSNFGMVKRELLSRISIPQQQIHRIKGEAKPDKAARDYERELEPLSTLAAGWCDIVLLGVGEDGHTGSLFPGSDVLREQHKSVRAVYVPHLASWRVTLTLPAINRARVAMFLVTGARKAAIVANILACTQPREDLPATLVRPESGRLTWMLDAEAASQLHLERPPDVHITQNEGRRWEHDHE